ncbi:MAG: hypothetical protein FJ106_08655 [Deltaproteobacteria bacterium]|nr:hypothetical protein [Deltaproteobacteria bacterium]
MNSAYTVDLQGRPPESRAIETGPWSETYIRRRSMNLWGILRITKIAGILLPLAVSTITAIPDPWLIEKRRRDTVVTVSIFQEVIGHAISRSEALIIARQILEQAEHERLALAEFEAARGIQWSDEL